MKKSCQIIPIFFAMLFNIFVFHASNANTISNLDRASIATSIAENVLMPMAQFSVAPSTGCALPHTVFITNQSTNTDSWVWDFGDGSPASTDQNPTHIYTSVGSFIITLVAIDTATGQTDTATQTVNVSATNTDFTGSPVFGCGPLTVDFLDNSSVNGGSIISWDWNFGDSNTSTAQNPTHTFVETGRYTVTLTVTTDNDCQSTLTKNNYVEVIGPLANFSAAGPTLGNAPLTVDFIDESVFLSAPQSWLWDFGNGDTSTNQNPTYTYTSGCGDYDVSLTVTDINGCERSITQVAFIQLTDDALNIECPPTQDDEEINQDCMFRIPDYSPLTTVTGNCNPVIFTQTPVIGTLVPLGNLTVFMEVFDGVNTANCNFEIIVVDATRPVLSCPGNQLENFDENCEFVLPDYSTLGTAIDECEFNLTVVQSPPAGTIINGITTVTFSASDTAGNTGICTFDVIPNDITAPTITCPSAQNEVTDSNCMFIIPDYTGFAIALDNCGTPQVTQTPLAGTMASPGITSITLTATDGINETSCSFNVTVINNNILEVFCPEDQQETANSNCSFTIPDYTSLASYTGNCGAVTYSQSPAPGTQVASGDHIITIIANDGAGSANCSFTLNVEDTIAPTIACPGNRIEDLNENCTFIIPDYTNLGIANDQCNSLTILQTPVVGTEVLPGDHTITLIAFDGFNQTSCTFNITAQDNTAPSISCLDTQTEGVNSSCQFFIPNYISQVTIIDNCNNNPSISQSPVAGTAVGIGVTQITITAFDGVNTNECIFDLVVADATAPIIMCPVDQIGSVTANCSFSIPDYTNLANATDSCSTPTITQDPSPGTIVAMGTTQITLFASDGTNTSQCQFNVLVIDDIPPTVNCANIVLDLDPNGSVSISADDINAGSGDNCGIASTSINITTFDCSNLGVNEVVLTATDIHGNITTCTALVTIQEASYPPVAICENVTVVLGTDGTATIQAIDLDAGSTGVPCAGGLSIDLNTFTCDDIGDPIPVTLTVTNLDGLTDSCVAFVHVIDDLSPELICPEDQHVTSNGPYPLPDFVAINQVILNDNCTNSMAETTQSPLPGTLLPQGTHTVTIHAQDINGLESSCSFLITVDDILNTQENENSLEAIILFPNPASQKLTISNTQQVLIDLIKVYDITGRIVLSKSIHSVSASEILNIETLQSGNYLVVFTTPLGKITKNLVKE